MRTITFRGKNKKDNTWVFGTYHYSNDDRYHYILAKEKIKIVSLSPSDIFCALHDKEVFDVNPKTVNQFTGLIDKNGNDKE
nr:hypothetical protein [Cyclobacteriaceae bacterium]